MKKLLTFLLALLCLYSVNIQAQSFSPESYIIAQPNPSKVFKSHIKSDSLILNKPSEFVSPLDSSIKTLISRMFRTVTDSLSRGVGIAAPQIGVNKRVIIVKRFDKLNEPFEAYINPKILQFSMLQATREEGCLSVDGIRCEVERPYAILVSYTTVWGESKTEMVEDYTARIFQHEIDHLDGILFTERKNKN